MGGSDAGRQQRGVQAAWKIAVRKGTVNKVREGEARGGLQGRGQGKAGQQGAGSKGQGKAGQAGKGQGEVGGVGCMWSPFFRGKGKGG